MDQQFIVAMNTQDYQSSQVLPNVFNERFYRGQRYIFITRTNRQWYICLLKKVENKFKLFGAEWESYAGDNLDSSVLNLHFVKESDDTFYVTGYNSEGIEWQGYDENLVGNRAVKCLVTYNGVNEQIIPGDFLQDMWKETFKVYINRSMYKVRHERVQTDPNKVERSNRIFGKGWVKMVHELRLAECHAMVFTNMGNNRLLLSLFHTDGTCVHDGIVFPSQLTLPLRTIPSYAMKDKRAGHYCSWEDHTDHYTEDNVCYTILNAPVYDKHQLIVPVEYSNQNELYIFKKAILVHGEVRYTMGLKLIPDLSRPDRKPHVKMTGNWKVFGNMCEFELPKILRLKLVDKVEVSVEGEEMTMPLFHVR